MESKFNALRKIAHSKELPYDKHFEFSLFEVKPWFVGREALTAMLEGENSKTQPTSIEKKIEPTVVLESEKEKTLESLATFTNKIVSSNEVDETNLKVSGGEVLIKKESKSKSTYLSKETWSKDVSSCQKCEKLGLCDFQNLFDNESLNGPLDVLFIGDYSKNTIDEKTPFQGKVNDLLDKMISAMGLEDSSFKKTTTLKCQLGPEQSVDFMKFADNCNEFLLNEIAHLRPKVIVALGARTANTLLKNDEKLSKIHGQFFDFNINLEGLDEFSTKLVPVFHPELMIINPSMKRGAWEDLQQIMKFLSE